MKILNVLNYYFNFLTFYRSIHVLFLIFLSEFGNVYLFRNLSIYSDLSNLLSSLSNLSLKLIFPCKPLNFYREDNDILFHYYFW